MCVKVHIEKRFITHFSFDIFRFWLSGNMLPGRGERAGVGGRGEFSDLIWPIRGCAAGQGWFLSSLF